MIFGVEEHGRIRLCQYTFGEPPLPAWHVDGGNLPSKIHVPRLFSHFPDGKQRRGKGIEGAQTREGRPTRRDDPGHAFSAMELIFINVNLIGYRCIRRHFPTLELVPRPPAPTVCTYSCDSSRWQSGSY